MAKESIADTMDALDVPDAKRLQYTLRLRQSINWLRMKARTVRQSVWLLSVRLRLHHQHTRFLRHIEHSVENKRRDCEESSDFTAPFILYNCRKIHWERCRNLLSTGSFSSVVANSVKSNKKSGIKPDFRRFSAKHPIFCKKIVCIDGGDEGDWTLDPQIANLVLSQLSYVPKNIY